MDIFLLSILLNWKANIFFWQINSMNFILLNVIPYQSSEARSFSMTLVPIKGMSVCSCLEKLFSLPLVGNIKVYWLYRPEAWTIVVDRCTNGQWPFLAAMTHLWNSLSTLTFLVYFLLIALSSINKNDFEFYLLAFGTAFNKPHYLRTNPVRFTIPYSICTWYWWRR